MKWAWLTLALLLGLVVPSTALAAGGPVLPVQNRDISTPGSPYRYVAFGAGRDTSVEQIQAEVVSNVHVQGHYGIPAASLDGTTTGLSADGRTLMLAEIPRNGPSRVTRLLVLAATPRLRIRARLTLLGFSLVDAISPNGRWLYLIQYGSTDLTRYAVRAYDLVAHRMLAKPIVDPRERDEAMTGFPIARVMSAGGRWAYTLYVRPTGAPFVHALDTVHRRAVCVDLPSLTNTDIGNGHLRLAPGGAALLLDVDGTTRARIDTRTFALATGAAQPASAPSPVRAVRPVQPVRPVPHERRASVSAPWVLIAALIAALGVLAAALALPTRPRRRRAAHRG